MTARPRPARRLLHDVVGLAAGLTILTIAVAPLEGKPDVAMLLALFAVAAGATAAVLAAIAAWLTADQRVGWLSLALGCYSVLAIPIGMLNIAPAPAVGAAVRFLVHCLVAVLLLLALIGAGPLRRWRAATALTGAAALIGATAWLGIAFPAATQAVTMAEPLRLGIALAWTGLALAVATLAAGQHRWPLWQMGLGAAVLAAAHTGFIGAHLTTNMTMAPDRGMTLACMRLLGIAVVLWGAARLTREALARLDADREAQEEDLRLAQLRLARTAERDHELRNGLAGLAGATNLLRTQQPDPDTALLDTAVTAELNRLDELLQTPASTRHPHPPRDYTVAPVLTGLVALRRSAGMDLRLDMEPGLRARGSSTTLAQVVTNLLSNAAQHAPGSPVWISAFRVQDRIVIRVRDVGPGVGSGRESAVFAPGVRGHRSVGHGLGLHICRRLLAAEDGTITIRPRVSDEIGCTVVVTVPAASPVARLVLALPARASAS